MNLMDRNKCVIAVPLYKTSFDTDEYYSISQLFNILGQYDIFAYCPNSLDISYYVANFNFKKYIGFWDEYFDNYPTGYNKLMLQPGFYEEFADYEYMLVYQPDCWVFRDELEYWCNKGYDYIGAPYLYTRNDEYKLKAVQVGNGGFSLRKISFWIDLCTKQKAMCDHLWENCAKEWGEDHILTTLSIYGVSNFNLPSYVEASKFAFECDPAINYMINGYHLPFGCHAYKKILGKSFYDDLNLYKDKKIYSIVTFLFGDYDILRDPDEVDPSCEYICLTDRTDLKSNVWKFVNLRGYDLSKYNDWQKTLIARYTALQYITTDICIKIDASVHIKKSPEFVKALLSKYSPIDAYFMIHPWRDNYLDEYDEWINTRDLDPAQKETFIEFCKTNNFDCENLKGMLMTTIMLQKNNEINRLMDKFILDVLMKTDDFNVRVDQTYMSIIFGYIFLHKMRCRYLSIQVLESDYFEYFYHNKPYTHSGEYKYDRDVVEVKYFHDNKVPCMYL